MFRSDIRATPPWARMSAGVLSSAITATASASWAIGPVGGGDIHDDAASERLGRAALDPGGAGGGGLGPG